MRFCIRRDKYRKQVLIFKTISGKFSFNQDKRGTIRYLCFENRSGVPKTGKFVFGD